LRKEAETKENPLNALLIPLSKKEQLTKTPHPSKLANPPHFFIVRLIFGMKQQKYKGRKVGGVQTPTELRSSRSEHRAEVHQGARRRSYKNIKVKERKFATQHKKFS